jgi:hypothetical protein
VLSVTGFPPLSESSWAQIHHHPRVDSPPDCLHAQELAKPVQARCHSEERAAQGRAANVMGNRITRRMRRARSRCRASPRRSRSASCRPSP